MTARLLLGDCLERMREIPDGSVGCVVTDPPYGQSNESYDRGVDPAVWRECHRVTGPNAALVSFAGGPTYHRIASDIEAAGWKVRQMWAWVYRDGMITSAYPKEGFDRLAPAMDPICYATKGKVLLDLEREGSSWSDARTHQKIHVSGRANSTRVMSGDGHWPRTLAATDAAEEFRYFALSRTSRHAEDRTGHPNQKPLALMRWIVAKLPRIGPILDPYMGSATTLIAAQAEGFDAIGIERDPAYFEIGRKRLAEAQAAHPLFAGVAE
jgi:site-specific DNA-methyltransferase (adenine-specific)